MSSAVCNCADSLEAFDSALIASSSLVMRVLVLEAISTNSVKIGGNV